MLTYGSFKNYNNLENAKKNSQQQKVECYPLYSMLLAIGQTKIDFFSLGEINIIEEIEFRMDCLVVYQWPLQNTLEAS